MPEPSEHPAAAPIGEHPDAKPAKRLKPSEETLPIDAYAEETATALESFWNGSAGDHDSALALERVFTGKMAWHDGMWAPGNPLVGLGRLQALRSLLRTAVPDLRLSLRRPLRSGEGGLVLGYWRAEGTQTGPLGPSLPPSGAAVSWEGSVLIRTQPRTAAGGTDRTDRTNGTDSANDPNGHDAANGQGGGEASGGEGTEAKAATAPEGPEGTRDQGLVGVELWWSWDPTFLYKQMGWIQKAPATAEGVEGSKEGPGGGADDGPAPPPADDLAMRVAAGAREAYGSEAEAVAAAEAAVARAAAAEAALAEARAGGGGAEAVAEALAAARAANRGVVELYFHTYNTGHYGVLDHIVDPSYSYLGLIDLEGRRGREGMRAMMGGWRQPLADLRIGHEAVGAVGDDTVAFRWVIRGTHVSPGAVLLGVPACPARPRPLHVAGVTALTLRRGRIAVKVSHANAAVTLGQLGAAVPPELPRLQAEGAESAGKEVGKEA